MNYDYLICGLHIRFQIPWALKITEESRPFLMEFPSTAAPDFKVEFCPVDTLSIDDTSGVWYTDSYYLTRPEEHWVWHCPTRGQPPYCCTVCRKHPGNVMTCYYVRGQEQQIAYTKNLLELLGMEWFLLRQDSLMLHASLVAWAGRGILFCAPSGTGKSTQAKLWEQYMHSQTLNGDRAGVRCDQGIWTAWGLPFAGTSGIYRNQAVPLCALVLLRQGTENRISKVTPLVAFKALLPECNARRWDGAFMERLAGLLSALIVGVPIYQLECRADREAVALLHDAILKENEYGNGTDCCGRPAYGILP